MSKPEAKEFGVGTVSPFPSAKRTAGENTLSPVQARNEPVQRCPDCGTPLDDDLWCSECEWHTGCELDENFRPRW